MNMKFPLDVSRVVKSREKSFTTEKNKTILVLCGVGAIVLYFILDNVIVNMLGAKPFVAVIIYVIIIIFALVTVYRFLIFDEESKAEEYKKYENDSFERFIGTKKDSTELIDIRNRQVNIFESKDGSMHTVMCFKFGNNNARLGKLTRQMLEDIVRKSSQRTLAINIIVSTEVFEQSTEYKNYINKINKIEDLKVARSNKLIMDAVMEKVRELNNTEVIYIKVDSAGYFFKDQIEEFALEVINLMGNNRTAFRSFEFLTLKELVEFYSDFYGVESIDLSSFELMEASNELSANFSSLMRMYSLETSDDVFLNTEYTLDAKDMVEGERSIN